MYTMNERKSFPYLYICGVGTGLDDLQYQKNFHLPVRYQEGGREVRQTYNDYTITVENAEALPIPKLELGWKGLPKKTTNCKNFLVRRRILRLARRRPIIGFGPNQFRHPIWVEPRCRLNSPMDWTFQCMVSTAGGTDEEAA